MPHIDSTKFGEITVDGKKYSQVLIVGEEVLERDYAKLKELFGTSHRIGEWETTALLSKQPLVVIVGTGQDGALEVDENFKEKMKENKIELIVEKTPQAIETYNQKYQANKSVNALIHTTC